MKFLSVILLTLMIGCKDQVSSDSNEIVTQDPVSACVLTDDVNPVLPNQVTHADNGSTLNSVQVSWQSATDNCAVSHYEIAIGLSAASSDILPFTNIGNSTSYQSTGVNFD